MIQLHKISKSSSKNLVYNQFHPHQKFGYACLSYYPANCSKIDLINAHILDSVLKFDIENIPKAKIEEALSEFAIQLNWRLYSRFIEIDCKEKGISFVIVINYAEEIIVLPFGRFVCGIWNEKGFTELGNKWENFTVKSMEDLNFLGNIAKDIKAKNITLNLKNRSGLLIIPANKNNFSLLGSWQEIINELNYSQEEFPHIFLSNGIVKENKTKRKSRK